MSITLKRATTTVELCTDLSLVAEHEDAHRRLADARRSQDERENSPVAAVAQEIVEIEERMSASTLVFTLAALPRKRFTEISEAHPPREGDELDDTFGLNVSTGIDAIISEPGVIVSVRNKTTGEAVDFDPAEWPALADQMSNAQWEKFALAVVELNRGRVSAPFSPAASLLTRLSDASSRPQSA